MKETIIERVSWWISRNHGTPTTRMRLKAALEALEAGDNYPILGLLQLTLLDLREALTISGVTYEPEPAGMVEMAAMIEWLKETSPKRKCPGFFRFKSQKCLRCPRPKSWHQTNHARR